MPAPTNPLFAKYAKKAPATEAAQAPTPKEVQAEVVKTEAPAPAVQPLFTAKEKEAMAMAPTKAAAHAPVVQEASNAIALVGDMFGLISAEESDASVAAMNAIMANEGGNSTYNLFPSFEQVRGNNGGMIVPVENSCERDIANMLPVGYRQFHAQYITHRFKLTCWSARLGAGESEQKAGEMAKAKPVWGAIIGPNDVEMVTLMSDASAKYGKTKTAERGKFDGFGHMTPTVEILFFLPSIGFTVFRGVGHYKSTSRTVRAVFDACLAFRSANNLPSGGLMAFPAAFTPKSTDEQGVQPWKCHSLDAAFAFTPDTKKVWDEYQAFIAQVKEDAEAMKTLTDWRSTVCSGVAKAAMERMLTV